ncbi:hypothetical protein GCM10009688_25890 [Arthrobacter gandavensis]|uniref:Uncharacterized protein n=1 Tax=Arthrobacter gandavensis TaxID=169960 RepID=A0ABP5ARB2_9MICC|nr:hypothetical protein [Arthrobacter citreus]
MEFVVIVLFVAAIVLVNFLVGRAQRTRAGRPAAEKPAQSRTGSSAKSLRTPAGTSLEAAREAAAQLDEKGHQQVYAAIAQGQPIRAIQIYAQNTGCGLRAASAAVASMASHPVPFTRPRPEQPPVPDASGPAPADSTDHPEPDEAPEDQTGAGRETADRDAAAHSAAASPAASESGTAGKDNPQEKAKGKEPAAPDDAEISKWAQNLRPEDF